MFQRHLCARPRRWTRRRTGYTKPHLDHQGSARRPTVTCVRWRSSRRHLVRARVTEGVRMLDLTRVLAGPVCGRTFAGESHFPRPHIRPTAVSGCTVNNSARRGRPARVVAAPARPFAALPRPGHLARQASDPARPQRTRGCGSGQAATVSRVAHAGARSCRRVTYSLLAFAAALCRFSRELKNQPFDS